MVRRVATLAALISTAIALGVAAPVRAQTTLSYVDLVHRLTDFDGLTRLQPGVRSGLFSSWDRGGRTVWGANGDCGQYLRDEPNGEAVMMEADGPGCIVRIWSANPMGRIRVYLDGAPTPSYEWDFPGLFAGKVPPFARPLTYQRDGAFSASDCYVPIPYARHIKVTADKHHLQYYHLNYLTFPKGVSVPSFRLPLTTEERTALLAAGEAWSRPQRDPKPRLANQHTDQHVVELNPGQTVVLPALAGPGTIRAIRARIVGAQRNAWRKVVLQANWDGASWPQVLSPLGPFFGVDWDGGEYTSLVAGMKGGQGYFHYPMPFRRSARFSLTSWLSKPVQVVLDLEWAPVASLPADSLYFYARWRHDPDTRTFDYPFVETAGRGHFVGVVMPIDHPLEGWWGEGDEKVWVDDDDFTPWIGTGSEDYFGDAWGIRYLPEPSFGCSSITDRRTVNFRWHFVDFVPFDKRFRMTIENYGPNGVGPRGQYEYNSVAYWYQAELTPPFDQLRGASVTGGDDPLGPPTRAAFTPNLFGPVDERAVRTYGMGLTFAREAEVLFADVCKAGKATIVTDAGKPFEYNRERAIDFGPAVAGASLGACDLPIGEGVVYYPSVYTSPEAGVAEVALQVSGVRVAVAGRPKPGVLELAGIYLPGGTAHASLVALTDGRAIVDCLRLVAAPRWTDAIEAEELTVSAVGAGPAATPSSPLRGASAGRYLQWPAAAVGQAIAITLPKNRPTGRVLGARVMRSPGAGIVQAFAEGKPIGQRIDLYAPAAGLSGEIVPLGVPPNGSAAVELRIVGHNAASTGYEVGVDLFRFEPQIISDDSAEGVWATVLETRGCNYSAQDLGPAFSHGHHLWINPSGQGASVDIAVELPAEGDYELGIRLTHSWDYGIVQASLDGMAVGPPVDCFAETVVLGDVTPLGKARLRAGRHILQIKVVGRNPLARASQSLFGVDDLIVRASK